MADDLLKTEIDCSATSQLPNIDTWRLLSGDNVLFVVSQKYEGTDTGYISRNATYDQVSRSIQRDFDIDGINQDIDEISSTTEWLKEFIDGRLSSTGVLRCNELTAEPYIISAMGLSDSLLNGLSGYYLSDGMAFVFSRHKFTGISADYGSFANLSAGNFAVSNISAVKLNALSATFNSLSSQSLSAKNIWLDGHSLVYADLVKDQFLSGVSLVSTAMVFRFKLADGNPQTISVQLSDFAGVVGFRDWSRMA